MINKKEKCLRKKYINEMLKKRSYFGYRLDITLIKFLVCLVLSGVLYTATNSFVFTVLIVLQVFLLLTVLNKKIIDNKAKKGKIKFYERIKKDKFRKKLFCSDINEIITLLNIYLNQKRYSKVNRVGKNKFMSSKDDKRIFIYFIKFFETAIVEKNDIRNYIAEAISRKSDKLMIMSINEMSEEATKLIDNSSKILEIDIVNFDDIFDFVNEYNLLGDSYSQLSEEDLEDKSKIKGNEILANILGSNKIKIYIMAAITIYVIEKILVLNTICVYVSYYFIFLAFINILYRMYNLFIKKNA